MKIQSKRIYLAGTFMPGIIDMADEKIRRILPYNSVGVDHDYGDMMIIPGMIDVHCHGGIGVDTNDGDEPGMIAWSKSLLQEGITSFCPTTVTDSVEKLKTAVAVVAKIIEEKSYGAQMVGIHLEGPYVNVEKKGAQPPQHILKPDIDTFKQINDAAKNNIRIVTLAPELDENMELTRYLASNKIQVALGHSSANFEQGRHAVANGANGITHCYNAMNPLHHRDPSLVGLAMNLDDIFVEIIGDGNHVAWPALKALITARNNLNCVMVDDALAAKGCAPGVYQLGDYEVEVRDNGSCYIVGTQTLAGGSLKFNKGLSNLINKALIPIPTAINMVTINPARYLKIDDFKGKIQAGYDGDLVVLKDDYSIEAVCCRGKIV